MSANLVICILSISSQVFASFPKIMSDQQEVGKCVNDILLKYAKTTDFILSIDNDVRIAFPVVHYKEVDFSLPLPMKHKHPDVYIIQLKADIDEILPALYKSGTLNARGKFIILTPSVSKEIIRTLFIFNILRVVLIEIDREENLNLFSYEHKIQQELVLNEIGTCHNMRSVELFEDSIDPTNIKEIEIAWLPDPPYIINENMGITMDIIKLIVGHLRLSSNMIRTKVTNRFGKVSRNGTFTGIWNEVLDENYDMFCGIVGPKDVEAFYFDITYPVLEDVAVFVLPILDDTGLLLFEVYHVSAWILIALSSLVVGIQFYIFSKISRNDPQKEITQMLSLVLELILEIASTIKPKSTSLRILLLSFLSTTMILNSVFKSKLYKMSVAGKPQQVITSVEDIVALGWPIGLHKFVLDQFRGSEGYYEKYLVDNTIDCDATLECLNQTAYQKNLVTAKLVSSLSYYVPKLYIDEEGKSLINVVKNFRIVSSYYSYFFRKGHPLFPVFNKKLEQMREGGFIDYIYEVNGRENEKALKLGAAENHLRARPISLKRFNEISKIFYISFSISVIVFMVEYWSGAIYAPYHK